MDLPEIGKKLPALENDEDFCRLYEKMWNVRQNGAKRMKEAATQKAKAVIKNLTAAPDESMLANKEMLEFFKNLLEKKDS